MGYKTFEDMKDKIPDGAAYYQNESEMFGFAWFNADKNKCHFNGEWYECSMEFYPDDQILPIPSQLDAHLGADVEWKNGDECVISAKSKSKWFVVGVSPITETSTICVSNTGELKAFHTRHLKKPETPQQREERERLEAAYDLYCHAQQNKTLELVSFDVFVRGMDMRSQAWLAIVDKTGYRKEK